MVNLEKYFNQMNAEVLYQENKLEEDLLKSVPSELHSFYKTFKSVSLKYGEIYDVNEAIKISSNKQFAPDWFVFGRDIYCSYWLCSYEPDKEGNSFTEWDHESGLDLKTEEAAFASLTSILISIEEDLADSISELDSLLEDE